MNGRFNTARSHGIKGGDMIYNDEEARKDAESIGMTVYYVLLLKKGPTWTPDETPEVNALQEAHLANYRRLAEMGKLVLTGPFLDSFQLSGEMRGMGVLRADSYEEAFELISTDPMVKANRLTFELHAWMIKKGMLP
ncbi:MAG: hypothetical protein FIB03_15455 [Anaerolineae bacterium]|nr:hypothetical protein [Anaerolineae bacterium]